MSKRVANVEIDKVDDIRTHVLLRPDQYVGAIVPNESDEFVVVNGKIEYKRIVIVEGLDRIVKEVISNAIDNAWRSKQNGVKCSYIKLWVDENGVVTVRNDGLTIPVAKGNKTNTANIWQPELVFGYFWTSSNYKDDDGNERKTSGRYGYGAKLTNALSKWLEVEVLDPEHGMFFSQRWEENMRIVGKQVIKAVKLKTGYTQVKFLPDFARFGLQGFTEDILGVIYRNMYDAVVVTGVKCYINDVEINIRVKTPELSMEDYARCFASSDDILVFSAENEVSNSLVALFPNSPNLELAMSNGIINRKGGTHLDAWTKAIFPAIAEMFSTKDAPLTTKDVREFFGVIVNTMVDRPVFSSQTKDCLTEPKKIATDVPKKSLMKILKWPVAESIRELIALKGLQSLQKIGAKKGFRKVEGMDHANLAHSTKQHDCTMIVCEGDSAKTFAITGISKGIMSSSGELHQGRDYFGIYPIGGKILNVRNGSSKQVEGNKHIQAIIQGLKLQTGVDYTLEDNFKRLPYTQVLIIADPDDDGIHIEGLIINLFHRLFPSLMRREKSFIQSMRTPLVRVLFKNAQRPLAFLRMASFLKWRDDPANAEQVRRVKQIKYFKGIGTNEDDDILESFGEVVVEYVYDEYTDDSMVKAFKKDHADNRKTWLNDYAQAPPSLDVDIIDPTFARSQLSISDFINKELIIFSMSCNERMIPCLMDGLKPSQRKILHTVYVLNLGATSTSLKVNRLAGAVGKETAYHHGEECLHDTIVGMAQNFTGSNNMPLLAEKGQFGSRNAGGADAANARYIETRRSVLADYICIKADLPVLEYLEEDGGKIEPRWFAPIIPLCLVNNCEGIGTGYSCNIPNYNPLDVISLVEEWIEQKTVEDCRIVPWYTGFTGTIIKESEHKYVTKGIVVEDEKHARVTELPIGYWTDQFKNYLDDLKENKKIAGFVSHSSKVSVDFTITPTNIFDCNEKNLHLTSNLLTSNMVLFTANGAIKRYASIGEIVNDFCVERFQVYVRRRNYELNEVRKGIIVTQMRIKFIEMVNNDEIVILKKKQADIRAVLATKKFARHPDNDNYDYLTGMSIDSLTVEKIQDLRKLLEKQQAELKMLSNISEITIWLRELSELREAYNKWLADWASHSEKLASSMTKGKGKRVAKAGRRSAK